MRPEQLIISPTKGINLDNDPRTVNTKDGEYLGAAFVHMHPHKVPTYMKGTIEVPWTKPAGANKCLGCFWRKPDNIQYQFHWNSLNLDSITIYDPVARTITVAAQGDFGFERASKISGVNQVGDDEWVRWVDSGQNPPRMLNLTKARLDGKKNKIDLYFPYDPNEVDQRVFGVTILLDGNTVTANSAFYTATSAQVFYFPEMLVAWAAAFNATFPQFTATACNDHVELEAINVGEWSIVARLTDTVNGLVQPQQVMLWEYSNRYNAPWDWRQLDAARFMPLVPPTVSMVNDSTRLVNDCAGHVFRFAVYYILKDRYTSNIGPWSRVVNPAPLCNGGYDGNTVLVDLSLDPNLSETAGIGEVDRIHLGVSIDGGPWLIGGDYPKAQWIYTRKITWANNGIYPAIAPAQATEFENAAPIRAMAQEQFADPVSPDNIRLAYAGCKEGHPTPCIPVKLNMVIEDGDLSGQETCVLRLLISVVNPWASGNFIMNQPVGCYALSSGYGFGGYESGTFEDAALRGQRLGTASVPNTGFVAYVEGLDVYAVSRQIFIDGSVPQSRLTFIPNTTVLDLTKTGAAVNPANRTHRFAFTDFVQGGGVVLQEILLPVPTGRRVKIRLASHKCAPLEDGTYYDLGSPTGRWRGSSTLVCGFNDLGFAHSTASFTEMDVDVPVGAANLYVGTCGVMSCVSPAPVLSTRGFISAYCIDDNGQDYSGGNDIRTEGTKAERQLCLVQAFDAINQTIPTSLPNAGPVGVISAQFPFAGYICSGRSVTDHNGFLFLPVQDFTVNYRLRITWISITGNLASPSDSSFAIGSGGVTSANGTATICNNGTENKWRGDIDPVAPLAGPDTTQITMTNGFAELVVPNLNTDARDKIRTFVEGSITTPDGAPLPGIKVTMANGHTTTTNQDGDFSVVAYGDMAAGNVVGANFNNRLSGPLLFSFSGACDLTFTTGNNYSGAVSITQFSDGLPYSEQIHFPMGAAFTATLSSLLAGAINGRGTTFQVALKLYDRNGRQTPEQVIGLVRIPALTEDLHDIDPIAYPPGTFKFGLARLEYEILGPVPIHPDIEYVRLQFSRGADQRSSFRFEWAATYIVYVSGIDESTGNLVTSNPTDAKEIYLQIGDGLDRYRDTNTQDTQVDANGDIVEFGQLGYTFTLGDRIQLLTVNGTPLTPLRDFAVRGMRGGYIVIANESGLPDLTGNVVGFRVYTPGTEVTVSDSNRYGIPFFELPEDSIEILNPFTNPTFAATSGVLHGGDTFRIATAIPVRPGFEPPPASSTAPWSTVIVTRETGSAIDSIAVRVPSLGRQWYADPQAVYQMRGTAMRGSNVWLPGTGTNGLSRFSALNIREADPEYGIATALVNLNGVLTCVCTVASFAAYPGRVVSQTGDGNLVSQAPSLFGTIRPYAVEAGCLDVASLTIERTSAGSWVKFWDKRRAQVVRLSVNGFDPITYGLDEEFFKLNVDYQGGDYEVVAGINQFHKEYWISFEPKTVIVNNIDTEAGGRTLVFYEPNNSWTNDRMLINPEMYGRTENEQQSFLNSSMWIHDADATNHGSFYGTKHPLRIRLALNDVPQVMKAFKTLWITPGADGWQASEVSNTKGQLSLIPAAKFQTEENVTRAPILFDLNTQVANPLWQGNTMRDSLIVVELYNDSTEEVRVVIVNAGFAVSNPTLR